MQRIASLCPPGERENLVSAVAQSLRLVINQRLARSTDGKRTPLREFSGLQCAAARQIPPHGAERMAGADAMRRGGAGPVLPRGDRSALRGGRISEETASYQLRQVRVIDVWRNTGHPVRVLMLDARACLPILSVMVNWRWTTLYVAIIGIAFFSAMSFFGLTLPATIRVARRWIVGRTRTAVPVWNRRRLA